MFPEEESETLTRSEDPAKDINFKVSNIVIKINVKIVSWVRQDDVWTEGQAS